MPIMASVIQIALAYLYFRFGHAWSRVLNRYVAANIKMSCCIWKETMQVTRSEERENSNSSEDGQKDHQGISTDENCNVEVNQSLEPESKPEE